jgi:hypothetical protein
MTSLTTISKTHTDFQYILFKCSNFFLLEHTDNVIALREAAAVISDSREKSEYERKSH